MSERKKRQSKYSNLLGRTFNSLTAIAFVRHTKGHWIWKFRCTCGAENTVAAHLVYKGRVKSCGRCGDNAFTGTCAKGHDVSKWGRTTAGTCKACVRENSLMTHYGLTWKEYIDLYNFQNGKCAICGAVLEIVPPGEAGWHEGSRIEVDHKHGTDLPKKQTVRGLLCGGRWAGCNRKLGKIDDPEWLQKVLDYVLNPPAQQMLTPLRPGYL